MTLKPRQRDTFYVFMLYWAINCFLDGWGSSTVSRHHNKNFSGYQWLSLKIPKASPQSLTFCITCEATTNHYREIKTFENPIRFLEKLTSSYPWGCEGLSFSCVLNVWHDLEFHSKTHPCFLYGCSFIQSTLFFNPNHNIVLGMAYD